MKRKNTVFRTQGAVNCRCMNRPIYLRQGRKTNRCDVPSHSNQGALTMVRTAAWPLGADASPRSHLPAAALALAASSAFGWASPAVAQSSSTTCRQVNRTTYCDTQQNSGGLGGPIGAFLSGYEIGWAASRPNSSPAEPQIPSAPPVSPSGEPVDTTAPFTLACRFSTGGEIQDKNLLVDPVSNRVNGNPAAFNADSINYSVVTEEGWLKLKLRHDVVINRVTGSVRLSDAKGRTEALGVCVPAARRMF